MDVETPGESSARWWRILLLGVMGLIIASFLAEPLVPMVHADDRQRDNGTRRARDAERLEKARDAYTEWRRAGVNIEVVGGKRVKQGSYRFTTLVILETPDRTFRCGGSLIDPLYVLTAAHCVEDAVGRIAPADDFFLVIGDATINGFTADHVRGVTRVVPHPDWNTVTLENDVAVLELDRAVPAHIATPVELVEANQTEFDQQGQRALVLGWGATSFGGPATERLLKAGLRVVPDANCNHAYGSEYFPSVMVCAAFHRRDSCQGDSGGPLLAKDLVGHKIKKKKRKKKGRKRRKKRVPINREVQMGIVSWGIGCADPNHPGVYTRLSAPGINDFIVETIN